MFLTEQGYSYQIADEAGLATAIPLAGAGEAAIDCAEGQAGDTEIDSSLPQKG